MRSLRLRRWRKMKKSIIFATYRRKQYGENLRQLLEDLGELELGNIQWIIVGGESGFWARPMKEEWVLNIREQARANGIPFFFKQWGAWGQDGIKRNKKANGKLLQGSIIQEFPNILL